MYKRQVLDGDPATLPKWGHSSPHFLAHVYCGQTAGWIKMSLGTKVGLGPGHIVLYWNPASSESGTAAPTFGLCLLWPKTAERFKLPLGTKVGLDPGHIVLDGDPAPLQKKGSGHNHQFSAHVYRGQMAGWIKMPLGKKVGLGPGHIVLDWDPAPPPKKGRAPNFRPTCIVTKRSPISATAEHL